MPAGFRMDNPMNGNMGNVMNDPLLQALLQQFAPPDQTEQALPQEIPQPPPMFQQPPRPANILQFPVNRRHLQEATEFGKAWIKHSAEFTRRKLPEWRLFDELYWNRRRLSQWNTGFSDKRYPISSNRAGRRRGEDHEDWQADFTIACQPFVDSYVQRMFGAIFSSDNYYIIDSRPRPGQSVEDPNFPTSRKLQRKVIDSCNDYEFKSRVEETLKDGARLGTSVSKAIWDEDSEIQINPQTGIPENKVLRHGTTVKPLDLANFLADPFATSGDVQGWSGIGDVTFVSYDVAASRFMKKNRPGPYNCGKAEFFTRWPEGGQPLGSLEHEGFQVDPDAYTDQSSAGTFLKAWDWYGQIHFSDRDDPTECQLVILTDLNAKDCSDGVVVRFKEGRANSIGRRPYLLYQFISTNSAFGMGIIEQNLDLIYYLSHLLNLFVDAVRLVSIPTIKALASSTFAEELSENKGSKWFPGKALICDSDINDIQPFSLQVADLASLQNLIQYLERMLEKRTSVSDATRGITETRKTATEVSSLQQNAAGPLNQKLALFAETFMRPFGRIALSNFADYIFEDQPIWMEGLNGTPQQCVLSVEEIRNGDYDIQAALDVAEQARISKAQTAIQMIPVLMNASQYLLMSENVLVKLRPIFEPALKNIDIQDTDKILELVDEEKKQAILMMMAPPQPPQAGQPPAEGQAPPPSEGEGGPPQLSPELQQLLSTIPAPGNEGGPAGSMPSSMNELLQRMQFEGMTQSPVIPGSQVAA